MKIPALVVLLCMLVFGISRSVLAAPSAFQQRLTDWHALTERLRTVPLQQRIVEINSFFNRLPYRSDYRVWAHEDYWASPLEFLEKGVGDCEDYAIAKYITLRKTGVPESQLRLAYVRHKPRSQAHLVLIVEYQDGRQVVMDNLTNALQSPERRGDLEPVYAFNDINLWTLDDDFQKRLIGLSSRLPNWVALKDKTWDSGLWAHR